MKLPRTIITPENYAVLLGDLRRIANASYEKDLNEINAAIVEMKWEMGKRLCEERIVQQEDSSSKLLLNKLAEDLNLEYTQLTRVVKFYKMFPDDAPTDTYQAATWSHYKMIITIADPEKRAFYLKRVEDAGLSMRALAQQMKDKLFEHHKARENAQNSGEDLPAEFTEIPKGVQSLYLYAGTIEKIIDGDTLDVRCDLGFYVSFHVRIRLRGVDAPELKSKSEDERKQAQQIKDTVTQWLSKSKTVVFQTYKTDVYGRYVADVFYLPGEDKNKELIFKQGNFLNQQLIDANLARMI